MPDPHVTHLLAAAADASAPILSINPPVLFFVLGAAIVLLRSSIAIPEAATKVLSLYLLWAIGFKGGVELVSSGLTAAAGVAVALGLGLGTAIPCWTYAVLRRRVPAADAAALAACYGSVSVVTFVTACAALDQRGVAYSGHMVAVMALMESPAILVALLLYNLGRRGEKTAPGSAGEAHRSTGALVHEALLNGPVLLLLGSIAVGVLTGQRGYAAFKPLSTDLFPGALAFFLLDMGMLAAKRAGEVARAPWPVLVFAIAGPCLHGLMGVTLARACGLGEGDAVLLAMLAASASYIAAPAALRLAVPRADPALYVSLSLALTFPFNIVIGIPLCSALVGAWR